MFIFSNIADYIQNLYDGHYYSCVEAVSHYITAIKKNADLNAMLEVYEEEAFARAAFLDEWIKEGKEPKKLHGVIISIKDVLCYKDHHVSAASRILENFTAVFSATAVEKLLAAGAIIIGRNNCDEFAMGSTNENSAFGKVLNYQDKSRVPGGSSGGSAVAVQAGLSMISLGSDTGGSVRQPADFCGIVGLKPGYGRISRYGLIAYASSFDTIGVFSNTIEDAALILEVIAGADAYDSTVSNLPVPAYSNKLKDTSKKYKIAYFKETLEHPSLDQEIKSAITTEIDALISAGHQVEAVSFPALEYVVPCYYVLTTAEASSNLSRYDGIKYGNTTNKEVSNIQDLYLKTRSNGFGKEVKRRIMLGTFVLSAGYYDAYFLKAQKVRNSLIGYTNNLFKKFDLIISPTVPGPAKKFEEITDDPVESFLGDIFTVFANLTGIPAISIPQYKHSVGMPFGIQLMAAKENEALLLTAANNLFESKKALKDNSIVQSNIE